MSLVPNQLEDWTLEKIEQICASGIGEGDLYDFKFGLQGGPNITNICCAFANSFGGYLVYGVREISNSKFLVEGLEPNHEFGAMLRQKVKADPQIEIVGPKVIPMHDSAKLLYIFHVPLSTFRPHLPSQLDQRIFWKRMGSMCVQMSLEEIRNQMLNYQEKIDKLTLLVIDLHDKLREITNQNYMESGSYSGIGFEFTIIDRVIIESYSILKEDSRIIMWINEIKSSFSFLNSQLNTLRSFLALSYDLQTKQREVDRYTALVRDRFPRVVFLISNITIRLGELYGVQSPFERPSALAATVIN